MEYHLPVADYGSFASADAQSHLFRNRFYLTDLFGYSRILLSWAHWGGEILE